MHTVSSSTLAKQTAEVGEVGIKMVTKVQEMAIQIHVITVEIDKAENPLCTMTLSKDLPADFKYDTQMVNLKDSAS